VSTCPWGNLHLAAAVLKSTSFRCSATSVLYVFASASNLKYLVHGSSAGSVYAGDIPISALCKQTLLH